MLLNAATNFKFLIFVSFLEIIILFQYLILTAYGVFFSLLQQQTKQWFSILYKKKKSRVKEYFRATS